MIPKTSREGNAYMKYNYNKEEMVLNLFTAAAEVRR